MLRARPLVKFLDPLLANRLCHRSTLVVAAMYTMAVDLLHACAISFKPPVSLAGRFSVQPSWRNNQKVSFRSILSNKYVKHINKKEVKCVWRQFIQVTLDGIS